MKARPGANRGARVVFFFRRINVVPAKQKDLERLVPHGETKHF